MISFFHFILKFLRKFYSCFFLPKEVGQGYLDGSIMDPEEASKVIYELLTDEKPCMIARYGGFEQATVLNYMSIVDTNFSYIDYIKGRVSENWWNQRTLSYMQSNAGFFPSTEENAAKFSQMMLEDTAKVELLGSWGRKDKFFRPYFSSGFQSTHLRFLEPFWSKKVIWTKALEGKRVLVVHPFAELIEEQYEKNRSRLFDNPDILPQFKLQTIKAVQSIGGDNNDFRDWFDALYWMESEIDKRDYDVCLIGCGAYGFPLAAHVKRSGKKAVHLGGSLQLLFGIKGSRWENPNYGVKEWGIPKGSYSNLINEFWVRPGEAYKPRNAENVENGCYW